jgi:protein-disulfide isomerase
VKREITDKTPSPTDAELKGTFEKLKGQTKASFESLAPRIRSMLTAQATAVRRNEYLAELRKQAKVKVRLDPPRFAVDTTGGHVDGPADARITLVEFSDYQCPFCGRSQDTVAKLLDTYKGTIRHVFMDFPLTNIHAFAKLAAVASHCADEQGKFAEYHRLLFDRQRDFSADHFKTWAGEIGLDAARFDACLASDRFDAVIDRSLQAGQAVGVSGTPGFFINGIPVHGAQPFAVFKKTIDDELSRAG